MTTRLTFSKGAHRYRFEPEGGGKPQPIKSVTTCLKVLAKDALVQWAANTAADYALNNWDALGAMDLSERRTRIAKAPSLSRGTAAAKGTQIHAWGDQPAIRGARGDTRRVHRHRAGVRPMVGAQRVHHGPHRIHGLVRRR